MFSLIFKVVTKLLKKTSNLESEKADMFLPAWILALGVICVIAGLVGIAVNIFYSDVFWIVIFSCLLIFGMMAILCYANQRIHILDNLTFQYTTFLGNKKIYRFYDIKGIKKGSDSITMFVGNDKVHIESCAILSQRLIEKIDEALELQYRQ